jgi:hypothetical protein
MYCTTHRGVFAALVLLLALAVCAVAAPVVVDTNVSVRTMSLVMVDGHPAIGYAGGVAGFNEDLRYVRASDPLGSSWGTPLTLDTQGWGTYTPSLAVVDGNPAISYQVHSQVKYVRATNLTGSAWGEPVTAAAVDESAFYTSLAVVGGHPAISYQKATDDGLAHLRYVRALDPTGAPWDTPLIVDTEGWSPGAHTSLAVVGGAAAISYEDEQANLKYLRLEPEESPPTIDSFVAALMADDTVLLEATISDPDLPGGGEEVFWELDMDQATDDGQVGLGANMLVSGSYSGPNESFSISTSIPLWEFPPRRLHGVAQRQRLPRHRRRELPQPLSRTHHPDASRARRGRVVAAETRIAQGRGLNGAFLLFPRAPSAAYYLTYIVRTRPSGQP